jgi:hypothetical protein
MRYSADDASAFLRKPAPAAKRQSPCERAAMSKIMVLSTLAAYGHCRPVEINAACFGSRSGLRMTQRCLRHLVESGEVKPRRNSVGSTSFVLTHIGARTLELRGLPGKHGLDIRSVSGATFIHHSITSRYVIEKKLRGWDAFTEFGIGAGLAPISTSALRARFQKTPDGVLIDRATNRLFLIEVECAFKPSDKIMAILSLANLVGARAHADLPYVFAGFVLVYAEPSHAVRIQRAARLLWSQRGTGQATLASRVILSKVDVSLPLVWHDFTETPLAL